MIRITFKKLICFIFMLIAALYLVQSSFCYADTGNSTVRVGLTSSYCNTDRLFLYNSMVSMGYVKNNSFSPEINITSADSCISLSSVNETFFVSEESFSSYSAALKASENLLKNTGYKSMPGIRDSRNWKIYIALEEYKKAASIFEDGPDVLKLNAKDFKKIKYQDYLIYLENGKIGFYIDGSVSKNYPQFKSLNKDSNGIYSLSLGKRSYRGRIEIGRYKDKKGLCAISILGMEEYLYGVITCEMNASYNTEALKAQAVCARSYAYTKMSANYSYTDPYELTDTASTQVYGGLNYETTASRKAVRETEGQVLTRNGNVISAFYFSTSGGHTEYGSTVWGVMSAMYQGVEDEFEYAPEKKTWIKTYTKAELGYMLKNKGLISEEVEALKVTSLTESGRALSIKSISSGKKNGAEISGTGFVSALSLPSAKFRIVNSTDKPWMAAVQSSDTVKESDLRNIYIISAGGNTVKASDTSLDQLIVKSSDNLYNIPLTVPKENSISFAGMGHGHGVGLSQSGANGLAEAGYNYIEILHYYFKGVDIGKK